MPIFLWAGLRCTAFSVDIVHSSHLGSYVAIKTLLYINNRDDHFNSKKIQILVNVNRQITRLQAVWRRAVYRAIRNTEDPFVSQ